MDRPWAAACSLSFRYIGVGISTVVRTDFCFMQILCHVCHKYGNILAGTSTQKRKQSGFACLPLNSRSRRRLLPDLGGPIRVQLVTFVPSRPISPSICLYARYN